MKNKEIEELLNDIKSDIEYYSDDYDYKNTVALFNVGKIESLLSHIEQLENKNKENSLLLIEFQDMEQRIKQLESKNESLLEDRKQLLNLVEQLENNRDKAIEFLEEKYERPISYYCCIKEALKILKGDSDE